MSVPVFIHSGRGSYNIEPPAFDVSGLSDAKQMDKIRKCGIKADLAGAIAIMKASKVSLANAMMAYSAGRRYAKGGR